MSKRESNNKPTESELEILNVLWSEGTATVRKVHEALSDIKDAGYTTTLKLMQIMHEKGLVARDDSGKTHIYHALVSKEKTQQQLLGKMMQTLFDGSPSQMMMQALGGHKPTMEEIEKIEQLLKQYK
jgi:BlaI family transcriptional regulator, penicillinase repressor